MTFTLNLSNGQQASANASFNVGAVGSPSMAVQNYGALTIDNLTGCSQQSGGPYLVYGNVTGPVPGCTGTTTGTAGISFTPVGTQPAGGSFSFVQLISGDTTTYSGTSGTLTCSYNPGLDTADPYAAASSGVATDAPEAPLLSTYLTASRSFNATMYLMWKPNLANSIRVPLGYQAWQFSGSTAQSGGQWSNPTGGGGPTGGFVVGSPSQGSDGYPTWSSIASRTCQ